MSSEKKERSFVIDAIILCVITLVLGGILAGVYTMTKGTIAQRQADTDSKACEKVIASVDGATVADAADDAVAQANDFLTKHILNSSKKVEEEQSESYSKYVNVTTVKKLQVNGSDAGYVYIADAKKGYGGSISFVLGVYNGTVTGIEITSQSETAGLVVELKSVSGITELDGACARALQQIQERHYDEYLRDEGREDIWAYGIAFYKKRCRVMAERI